jgi:phosphatidylserine/phosphatidylglycerophosphate/cardiolipin synthase-like enzyme
MKNLPTTRRRASRSSIVSPLVVLLALLALFGVYLYRSGTLGQLRARAGSSADRASIESGAIQVFFTTPTLIYPDQPARRTTSPLLHAVLADLDSAHASVDLATFDFDIVEVTDALIHASQRGAIVRVIVDSENLDTPEVAEQTGRLQRAGIAVHFDRREPFMHKKLLLVVV